MTLLKTFVSPDGRQRIHIVRRPDGAFSFLLQGRVDPDNNPYRGTEWPAGFEPEDGWGPPSHSLGIYDSPETSEWEALCKVEWMIQARSTN